MSSSDLTELSSSPLSEDDLADVIPKGKLEHYFKQGLSALPPKVKKKRPPSPPHEYVLADNPDIALICMFRSRFSDVFPKSLPHYGPQDIERGIVDSPPGEQVERLLCALLGLLLNRKKEVEKGHYSRALEEAVQTHSHEWSTKWEGKNPLHGGGNFNNMSPEQRLTLLKTLIMWCLDSSDAVKTIIKDSYKQARRDDDLNQPLSVQAWGQDGDKRRFWLIEGQDDTHFRLYRESNSSTKRYDWRSVAGNIEEAKALAKQLGDEGSQASRRLSERILAAVPRFEASEEKRKRRDYRIARRAQFARPEPGFSLYEGRTRGKRIRYTYSDDEDAGSDVRQSERQSGISTPAEPSGPTFTASGRQVRSRHGGTYGESVLSGQQNDSERRSSDAADVAAEGHGEPNTRGRPSRAAQPRASTRPRGGKHIEGYNSLDEMDDESEATSSGNEWDGGDEDDDVDDQADDEDEDEDIDPSEADDVVMEDESSDKEHGRRSGSLLVSFRYSKNGSSPPSQPVVNGASVKASTDGDVADGRDQDQNNQKTGSGLQQHTDPTSSFGSALDQSFTSHKTTLPSVPLQHSKPEHASSDLTLSTPSSEPLTSLKPLIVNSKTIPADANPF